jgi:Flp pilus assembly protein TadG
MSGVPRLRAERGAVELIVAFALVALLGFAALIVDVGNAKQTRRNLQTAADSGSLAGVPELPSVASAKATAAGYVVNSMNQRPLTSIGCPSGRTSDPAVPNATNTTCYRSNAGAIVYVTTPYTFIPPPGDGVTSPDPHQTINVTICQTLQTTFARVLGIDTTHPCNSGTAAISPSTGNCVICVMGTTAAACTFKAKGSATLSVSGVPPGPIAVRSPDPGGVCGGDADVKVNSPGGFTWTGCVSPCTPAGQWTPPISPGPTFDDPLKNVPVPSVAGPIKTCADGATCNPGVYSTITAQQSTTTLNPGVYVVTGSINMKQNGTLLGNGVMIYFACSKYPTPCKSTGEAGAGFLGNGGNVGTPLNPLAAPTSGTYSGLLIFADRNNTADLLGGNGNGNGNINYNLRGTIYGLNASMNLGGLDGQTLDSRIVIGSLTLQGNPSINETYADQFQGLTTQGSVALIG